MATVLVTPSNTLAKLRWTEQYVSEGLNKKFNGIVPPGVLRGGRLGTSLVNSSVTVEADPDTGDSIYSFIDANGYHISFRQVGDVSLDLDTGALPGTTVYIGLDITYTISAATVVEWTAFSQAEVDADDSLVILGSVDVPAVAALIPATDILYDRRRDAGWNLSSGMRDWRQVVPNPSFEGEAEAISAGEEREFLGWNLLSTGAGQWRILTPGSVPVSQPHSGNNNIEVNGGGGGFEFFVGTALGVYRVTPGQTVKASMWVRGDGVTMGAGASGIVGFQINAFQWDGSPVSDPAPWSGGTISFTENGSVITGTFDYIQISGEFKVPAEAAFIRILIVVQDSISITGRIGIDDVQVWMEPGPVHLSYDRRSDFMQSEILTQGIVVGPLLNQDSIGYDPDDLNQRMLRLLCKNAALATVEHEWSMVNPDIDSWLMSLPQGRINAGETLSGNTDKAVQALARMTFPLPDTGLPANAKFILIWEGSGVSAGEGSVRVYASSDGYYGNGPEFIITMNAEFDPATDQWSRDKAGVSSSMYVFSFDRFYRFVHESGSASPWAIAAWDHTAQNEYFSTSGDGLYQYLLNAIIAITGTTTLSNPAYGSSATANALYAKNIPKAWGYALTDGAGGFTTREGFGASMSLSGSGRITVTFNNAMDSANYAVAGLINPVVAPPHADWSMGLAFWSLAAGSFDLTPVDRPTGTWGNFDTETWEVSYMVFGQQTT